jgi:hypothetical protein
MKLEKSCAFLLLALLVTTAPLQAGENASENEKNKIPICTKLVPIESVLDPAYPAADRVEVINNYEVPIRLEHAIACDLERQKYIVAKPFQLKVTLKGFRLRSGGSVFMGGRLAGADVVSIDVEVLQTPQDTPVKFESKFDTTGGLSSSPTKRLNSLVQKVARDVGTKLMKQGFLTKEKPQKKK